jgi:superfamily I DNA/RNA helicase
MGMLAVYVLNFKWTLQKMKTLPLVKATPEQLPLISQNRFGVEVICGAAGSGKTSTALLRLRSLCYMFAERHERKEIPEPVKILVLTFNRTLAGYISSLAEHQVEKGLNISLEIDTFSRWAISSLNVQVIQQKSAREILSAFAVGLDVLTPEYILKEVDYLLGRFEPESLENYITFERTGRGVLPRVDRNLRRRILDEVVYPYLNWLSAQGSKDWNELSVSMARDIESIGYDIVVVDESQDFSANQLRAIKHHLAPDHTVTFVIDTVQRIYARGFTWAEAGFDVRPERIHPLYTNHRNTVEIAAFAAGILNGVGVDGDGALPNLNAASDHGDLPQVLLGKYSDQAEWAANYIKEYVNLEDESVAFLKPQAGKWFDQIKSTLARHNIDYVDITREREWPEGPENVALSTFHSAKGLEFDYVFIIGFNEENTHFAEEEFDDQVLVLRRLLAVAVARARKAVIIGYKPGEGSQLVRFFSPGTFGQEAV